MSFPKLVHRVIRERRPELALALDDRYLAYDGVTPRGDEPPPRCPACGRRRNLPLLYGKPDARATLAESLGEIVLGGCESGPENRVCIDCDHRWRGRAGPTAPRRAASHRTHLRTSRTATA